jgi:hypothetical protein
MGGLRIDAAGVVTHHAGPRIVAAELFSVSRDRNPTRSPIWRNQ